MEYLHYKGYVGNVEPDKTNPNRLCGKVLGLSLDSYIRYQGDNLSDLQANFQAAVDRYIAQESHSDTKK